MFIGLGWLPAKYTSARETAMFEFQIDMGLDVLAHAMAPEPEPQLTDDEIDPLPIDMDRPRFRIPEMLDEDDQEWERRYRAAEETLRDGAM